MLIPWMDHVEAQPLPSWNGSCENHAELLWVKERHYECGAVLLFVWVFFSCVWVAFEIEHFCCHLVFLRLGIPAWCSSINDIVKWDDKDDQMQKCFEQIFLARNSWKLQVTGTTRWYCSHGFSDSCVIPGTLAELDCPWQGSIKVEGKHVPISQTATEQFDIQIWNSLKIQGPWEKGSAMLTTGEGWLAESWR